LVLVLVANPIQRSGIPPTASGLSHLDIVYEG
jgi:hypothetical protein